MQSHKTQVSHGLFMDGEWRWRAQRAGSDR